MNLTEMTRKPRGCMQEIDPVARRVTARSLITRVSVTTLLAAAKLERLVLSEF